MMVRLHTDFSVKQGKRHSKNDAQGMGLWAPLSSLYAHCALKWCLIALIAQVIPLRSKGGGWRISQVSPTECVRAYRTCSTRLAPL